MEVDSCGIETMLYLATIILTTQATSHLKLLKIHLFSLRVEPLRSVGQRDNHQPVGSVEKLAAV